MSKFPVVVLTASCGTRPRLRTLGSASAASRSRLQCATAATTAGILRVSEEKESDVGQCAMRRDESVASRLYQ